MQTIVDYDGLQSTFLHVFIPEVALKKTLQRASATKMFRVRNPLSFNAPVLHLALDRILNSVVHTFVHTHTIVINLHMMCIRIYTYFIAFTALFFGSSNCECLVVHRQQLVQLLVVTYCKLNVPRDNALLVVFEALPASSRFAAVRYSRTAAAYIGAPAPSS